MVGSSNANQTISIFSGRVVFSYSSEGEVLCYAYTKEENCVCVITSWQIIIKHGFSTFLIRIFLENS